MKRNPKRHTNTFTSILSLLGVKYTNRYANKYFNEHPHKHNMLGFSEMLTHYNVFNKGIKVEDKEDIYSFSSPFIAHIDNEFVTIESISRKDVVYYSHRNKMIIPTKDFLIIWTGIALLVETNETSIEPDYKQHRYEDLINYTQRTLLLFAGIAISGIGFIQSNIYQSLGLILILLLNLIGVFISYLLVQKQFRTHSGMADEICSLFVQSNCNDLLNTPAANFLGIIGWSEIGFSYFLSNIFILLFTPHLIFYLVLLNILTLPYSFWSVWYQKSKAKTWCPLCLIVQSLLWILFFTCLFFGYVQIPKYSILNVLSISLIYGTPLLLIDLLLPYQVKEQKTTEITQQFNSLKLNDRVFMTMLKENTFYEVNNISSIILGNPEAKNTITIFTNPHCDPCAKMHKKIEKLLKDTNNQFRIQYILSSFHDKYNSSSEFFIYINRKHTKEERDRIYNEWFTKGKYNREKIFKNYSFTTDYKASEEFQRHLRWQKETNLQSTPTVIFNGYKLPNTFFYQIEDLIFFTNLNIDSN